MLLIRFERIEVLADDDRDINKVVLIDLLDDVFFFHAKRVRDLLRCLDVSRPVNHQRLSHVGRFVILHLHDIIAARAQIAGKLRRRAVHAAAIQQINLNDLTRCDISFF